MSIQSVGAISETFLPWKLKGAAEMLGLTPPIVADILVSSGLFVREDNHLWLAEGDVGEVLDAVRMTLAERGLIEPLRGENMPVMQAPDLAPIASIDRSAMRILGLWATKVHINGICRGSDDQPDAVWLARRSQLSRAAPGAYDTLVAGGVPFGAGWRETALREAWEEAGLEPAACEAMTAAGAITATYITDQGYHREHLVIYDLVLEKDFEPRCRDGEIESFDRMLFVDLAAAIGSPSLIKTSSGLACHDLLQRRSSGLKAFDKRAVPG